MSSHAFPPTPSTASARQHRHLRASGAFVDIQAAGSALRKERVRSGGHVGEDSAPERILEWGCIDPLQFLAVAVWQCWSVSVAALRQCQRISSRLGKYDVLCVRNASGHGLQLICMFLPSAVAGSAQALWRRRRWLCTPDSLPFTANSRMDRRSGLSGPEGGNPNARKKEKEKKRKKEMTQTWHPHTACDHTRNRSGCTFGLHWSHTRVWYPGTTERH